MLHRRLLWLLLALVLACAVYMTFAAKGSWSFLLPFRGQKLAALVLVGASLSVATVLFQTITGNRILTPSIMGFDQLFIMIQTVLVFMMGSADYVGLPALLLFALNIGLMSGLGLGLFTLLRRGARGEMMRLVLTGIIFGVFLRSATGFVQRMIDPVEFSVVTVVTYARFNTVDGLLLVLATLVTLPALWAAWRMRARLDVLGLGETVALGLGEPPRRSQSAVLVLICTLVASATALVGPMAAFFGLIVSALAHVITPTERHAILLPSAALTGAVVLVGGQTLLERVLGLATPISVVVEAVGGALFLFLLLKRRRA
ncbi:iron complex transport system permease protein [Pseudooceanicola antarcticus]|uniref:Enterobactin ABC transporter permease n=1 Tax=Pseudooceanicola antarcticus TaxID=1247613 RepID=A0A285IRH1_9RHOB|nr:iron chelate uptake ABC transporter family permease subunit [Pseudooceanicola antarcticus]PJE31849.1 enterobactin ABC transporter permease [Pseudooceanicola antarcticus]SNY50564.1 iron complex transport system permease protein [Pseudooceanicola antarcticus]